MIVGQFSRTKLPNISWLQLSIATGNVIQLKEDRASTKL
jgi:hypothetical protein